MKKISVVIPCYNEEEAIPLFHEAFVKETSDIDACFELLFIDDGSHDQSLAAMKALSAEHDNVKYISFSRNFGKEAGMLAGLKAATGDYIAIMDVDLQDPPRLLKDMLEGIEKEGFDCVAGQRISRKGEPPVRSFFARLFYKFINLCSRTQIVDGARDFRLMTRQMVDSILQLRESSRFSKGIFSWVGFRTKWLEYENTERVAGNTKWSFWKLLIYAFDGIICFSAAPLMLVSLLGILFCLVSFMLLLFYFVKTLLYGDPVAGFPTLVCLITFLSGTQLFCTGILGQYLAKIYNETKQRPVFIVKETNTGL